MDLSNNDLESGLSLGIMEIDKKIDLEENIKDAIILKEILKRKF